MGEYTYINELCDHLEAMILCVDKMHTALRDNSIEEASKVTCVVDGMYDSCPELAQSIQDAAKTRPEAVVFLPVPAHIERIRDNIGRMGASFKKKIKEDILFSDKATIEVISMLEKTRDILLNIKDLAEGRHDLVVAHIMSAGDSLNRDATRYAEQHEERMMQGICMPKASAVFLQIIESVRAIEWHAKEIAKAIGKHATVS